MLSRNAQGQTIRIFSYTSPMRKHGGFRHERKAMNLDALDAIARKPVKYDAPTVRVRKVHPPMFR